MHNDVTKRLQPIRSSSTPANDASKPARRVRW